MNSSNLQRFFHQKHTHEKFAGYAQAFCTTPAFRKYSLTQHYNDPVKLPVTLQREQTIVSTHVGKTHNADWFIVIGGDEGLQ